MSVSREHFYHDSYAAHRGQFIDGCREAGGAHDSVEHPLLGPSGERLAVDVTRFGSADASKLLVVVSGTHGVEGFCGSAIQASLLNAHIDRLLPTDVGLLLVHALNPYGFAWQRRTDAENIDLNRNFRDFTQPAPANPAYEEVHAALVPSEWSGPERAKADQWLESYISDRGMRTLQAAVFGGQYDYPDGMVFGGYHPSWSNQVWQRILLGYASKADLLAVLDVHSGLGAPGRLRANFRRPGRERRICRCPGLVWFFPCITRTHLNGPRRLRIHGRLACSRLTSRGLLPGGGGVRNRGD